MNNYFKAIENLSLTAKAVVRANENNCNDCDNIGWLESNSERGADETQRCDNCKVYDDDLHARVAKNNVEHWARLRRDYPAIERTTK